MVRNTLFMVFIHHALLSTGLDSPPLQDLIGLQDGYWLSSWRNFRVGDGLRGNRLRGAYSGENEH